MATVSNDKLRVTQRRQQATISKKTDIQVTKLSVKPRADVRVSRPRRVSK
jgi:hypothetical protein